MTTEITPLELTDVQWQIAHKIAQELAEQQLQIDPQKDGIETEFKKVLSYLREKVISVDQKGENFSKTFSIYLEVLKKNSKSIGHGKHNTSNYHAAIEKACRKPLSNQDNPEKILVILGWAIRLIRYYKQGESLNSQKYLKKEKAGDSPSKTSMAAAFEKLGF
ncbi:hypothetical protein [Leptolyngbya sp. PCC 6406]|uniref:hypothetical protein n=1 Tax=Leptolyngbya sp. PCC 6406 TaxID=1173264 RepID=UPI0002AC2B94|nr:hypothetical protein [Leptolyngbya sp. PCC 6406]